MGRSTKEQKLKHFFSSWKDDHSSSSHLNLASFSINSCQGIRNMCEVRDKPPVIGSYSPEMIEHPSHLMAWASSEWNLFSSDLSLYPIVIQCALGKRHLTETLGIS